MWCALMPLPPSASRTQPASRKRPRSPPAAESGGRGFAEQLKQLAKMGFGDEEQNTVALVASDGDVQAAVQVLVSQ